MNHKINVKIAYIHFYDIMDVIAWTAWTWTLYDRKYVFYRITIKSCAYKGRVLKSPVKAHTSVS